MCIYYLNQVISQVSGKKAGIVLHKTTNPVRIATGTGFVTYMYLLLI
jgi:hypothetical protein